MVKSEQIQHHYVTFLNLPGGQHRIFAILFADLWFRIAVQTPLSWGPETGPLSPAGTGGPFSFSALLTRLRAGQHKLEQAGSTGYPDHKTQLKRSPSPGGVGGMVTSCSRRRRGWHRRRLSAGCNRLPGPSSQLPIDGGVADSRGDQCFAVLDLYGATFKARECSWFAA